MRSLSRALIVATCFITLASACAGGRVRGGQGTEMQQEEEYLPIQKVKLPEGNTNRVSGPINSPTPPPVLEVDLERRRHPAGPSSEPDPEPQSNPEAGNNPE
ncbi:MAG: hypothetical protein WCE62_18400 [Polyangiales bacterium]